MSRYAAIPLVTVCMLDWYQEENTLALPLSEMSVDEIDRAWSAPNRGGIAAYLDRVSDVMNDPEIQGPAPWEFRGVRWADTVDGKIPDLLPHEVYVPGGAATVVLMQKAMNAFDDLETAGLIEDDDIPPANRLWPEITEDLLASLRARLPSAGMKPA